MVKILGLFLVFSLRIAVCEASQDDLSVFADPPEELEIVQKAMRKVYSHYNELSLLTMDKLDKDLKSFKEGSLNENGDHLRSLLRETLLLSSVFGLNIRLEQSGTGFMFGRWKLRRHNWVARLIQERIENPCQIEKQYYLEVQQENEKRKEETFTCDRNKSIARIIASNAMYTLTASPPSVPENPDEEWSDELKLYTGKVKALEDLIFDSLQRIDNSQ